jgi:hypothetical protein
MSFLGHLLPIQLVNEASVLFRGEVGWLGGALRT